MFLIFQRAPVLILCPVLSEATRPSFRSRRSRVAKKGRRKGGPPHCRENSIGSAIGRGGVVIFDPAIDLARPSTLRDRFTSEKPAYILHLGRSDNQFGGERVRRRGESIYLVDAKDAAALICRGAIDVRAGHVPEIESR